ncbi:hypothetical protein HDV04_001453 [Boothiomyces sp. JEL0838]|nr:hypothetical protein HDV04_001453 [Boothiomyces sp. JEL0838]
MKFTTLLAFVAAVNAKFPSGKIFAPYALYDDFSTDVVNSVKSTGVKFYRLAFVDILKSNGKLVFNSQDLNSKVAQVKKIRDNGGDIIISFGGALPDGTQDEIAGQIADVNALVKAYQSVIDLYQPPSIDFDIEAGTVTDEVMKRRNDAIKILKQNNQDLHISLTVAVGTNGLVEGTTGITAVRAAAAQNVPIDVVNIMAMDYGASTPNGDTKMGDYAISAAKGTHDQLKALNFPASIGITPMIGKNDQQNLVFSLDNAKQVVDFANSVDYISLLSFWGLQRDVKFAANAQCNLAASSCVVQNDFDFTKVFNQFNCPDGLVQQGSGGGKVKVTTTANDATTTQAATTTKADIKTTTAAQTTTAVQTTTNQPVVNTTDKPKATETVPPTYPTTTAGGSTANFGYNPNTVPQITTNNIPKATSTNYGGSIPKPAYGGPLPQVTGDIPKSGYGNPAPQVSDIPKAASESCDESQTTASADLAVATGYGNIVSGASSARFLAIPFIALSVLLL